MGFVGFSAELRLEDEILKSILLICNYFAPENEIAAIRLTKFAKYLKRSGYHVEVLAEKKDIEVKDVILEEDAEGIPIHYATPTERFLKLFNAYKKFTNTYREEKYADTSWRKIFHKELDRWEFIPFEIAYPGLGGMDRFFEIWQGYDLACSCKVFLKERAKEFDICFSSHGNYFGHFAAHYLKKVCSEMIWIADFRDPVNCILFTPKQVLPLTCGYERMVHYKANAITVVSPTMLKAIPEMFRSKAYCLTNGFDREDREAQKEKDKSVCLSAKFSFCYTGRMYGGLQDISPLFSAVRALVDEGTVDLQEIAFVYAGTGFEVFEMQAKQYALEHCCVNLGYLPREQALQIQVQSTLLVISSFDWKDKPEGVITGKFLEYLGASKPMIVLIRGDFPESDLAKIAVKVRVGCVYEETHRQTDMNKLKQYLKRQYSLFKHKRTLYFRPNQEERKRFDYEVLSKQLIKIIEEHEKEMPSVHAPKHMLR